MSFLRRAIGKLIQMTLSGLSALLPRRGRVLMFHSIGDPRHDFNLSPAAFEQVLRSLAKIGVSPLDGWKGNKDFVCLTFDDVPDSFYHTAFPLLKKYRLPFTVFISCTLLDTDGYLSTAMLKEIAACPLAAIGSHGWNHTFFSDYGEEEALADLTSSRKRLEEITGRTVDLYAFPYGSVYACGLRRKSLVRKVYSYGFGTVSMPVTSPRLTPLHYLPRINVDEDRAKAIEAKYHA